jgi:hypothetical protein
MKWMNNGGGSALVWCRCIWVMADLVDDEWPSFHLAPFTKFILFECCGTQYGWTVQAGLACTGVR